MTGRGNKALKIFKSQYAFSVISKIFCVLVGFIFTVFQSRFLGAEIKGQVATINSILSVTSIVFAFGIYQAYPYYKKNSDVDVMPIFMKIGIMMLLIYLGIASFVVFTFELPLKYIAVIMLTPLLAYDGLVSYITLVEEPTKRNITDVIVMIEELALVIILWLTAKPTLLLGVIIITIKDITKSIVFTFWWRKRIFIKSEPIKEWIPKLVKFGFFPMMSLLMSTLNYRVDVIMLNGQVADAAIGVYSVGSLIAERVWMIPDAMKGVMVSKIAKGKDANETAYVIRLSNTACLAVVAGIIALGKPFIDLVFGPEYAGSYEITLILLIGVFPMIYYKAVAAYNIVMGKQLASFIMLGIGVIANVAGNLILIPRLGIYGAGVASVISYLVSSILFAAYFCKNTGIPIKEMLLIDRDDYRRLKEKLKK